MSVNEKMTAIADAIRAKTGKTDALTLDRMPGEIGGLYGAEDVIKLLERAHTEFVIPDGCTKIASYTFHNQNLLRVTIPESVTTIGSYAFGTNSKLQLTTPNLPDSIETIGGSAFAGTPQLTLYQLPENLKTVGDYAFQNSGLRIGTVPKGVTTIGKQAFGKNLGITQLTFLGTPTSIASNAFYQSDNLIQLNVPWLEGEISGAPWGAANATIYYGRVVAE